MKCSVKQYCAYLCRIINQENRTAATALTEQLTYADSNGLPKKGVPYGKSKKTRGSGRTGAAHRPA